MKKLIPLLLGAIGIVAAGAAYAGYFDYKEPVEFFLGHTHDENGNTHGAPQHSGGLDRRGCHNRSVPYHCH